MNQSYGPSIGVQGKILGNVEQNVLETSPPQWQDSVYDIEKPSLAVRKMVMNTP